MAAHSSILAWRVPWTEVRWATVHRIAKSQTRLSTHSHTSCWWIPDVEEEGNPVQIQLDSEGALSAWWCRCSAGHRGGDGADHTRQFKVSAGMGKNQALNSLEGFLEEV